MRHHITLSELQRIAPQTGKKFDFKLKQSVSNPTIRKAREGEPVLGIEYHERGGGFDAKSLTNNMARGLPPSRSVSNKVIISFVICSQCRHRPVNMTENDALVECIRRAKMTGSLRPYIR